MAKHIRRQLQHIAVVLLQIWLLQRALHDIRSIHPVVGLCYVEQTVHWMNSHLPRSVGQRQDLVLQALSNFRYLEDPAWEESGP